MASEPTDEQKAAWAEQDRVVGSIPDTGDRPPKTGSYQCGLNGDRPCPTDPKLQRRCPSC